MSKILRKYNSKLSAVLVFGAVLLLSHIWCSAEDKEAPEKRAESIQSATLDAPMRQHYGRHYGRFVDRMNEGRGGPGGGIGRGPGKGMGMGRGSGMGRRGFNPKDFGGRGPEWRSYVREQFSAPDRMERLRKDSPELVEIIEASKLVSEKIEVVISAAIEDQTNGTLDSAKLKNQIEPLLTEECDLEMKRKYMELEIMEKKIKQIRETLDRRKKYQSRLLELKLNRILEDPSTALTDKRSVKRRVKKDE